MRLMHQIIGSAYLGGASLPATIPEYVTVNGFYMDTAVSGVFTDTGGTSPVSSNGQLVKRINDLAVTPGNYLQMPSNTPAPTWITPGSVVNFDGGSDYMYGQTSYLPSNTAQTFMARVYPTSITANRCVIGVGTAPTGDQGWLGFSAGVPHGYVGATILADPSPTTYLNTWVTIALTWTASACTLYVNGSQVDTDSRGGTVPSRRTAVGSRETGSQDTRYAGRLSHVIADKRVFSAAEIAAIHDAWTP